MTPQDPRPRWIRCSPFSWGSFIPYNMPVYPRALRTADDPSNDFGDRCTLTLAFVEGRFDRMWAMPPRGNAYQVQAFTSWRISSWDENRNCRKFMRRDPFECIETPGPARLDVTRHRPMSGGGKPVQGGDQRWQSGRNVTLSNPFVPATVHYFDRRLL